MRCLYHIVIFIDKLPWRRGHFSQGTPHWNGYSARFPETCFPIGKYWFKNCEGSNSSRISFNVEKSGNHLVHRKPSSKLLQTLMNFPPVICCNPEKLLAQILSDSHSGVASKRLESNPSTFYLVELLPLLCNRPSKPFLSNPSIFQVVVLFKIFPKNTLQVIQANSK